jgi:transposase
VNITAEQMRPMQTALHPARMIRAISAAALFKVAKEGSLIQL